MASKRKTDGKKDQEKKKKESRNLKLVMITKSVVYGTLDV